MTAAAPAQEPVYTDEISPTATVHSTDEEFIVDVSVAGFHVAELQIDVVDHALHVHGDASTRPALPRPTFEFWFALPPLAEEDTVEAVLDHGVLEIHAPVRPSTGPRTVEIATWPRFVLPAGGRTKTK
jgi:HSP20 family molecular chaperone IbpA